VGFAVKRVLQAAGRYRGGTLGSWADASRRAAPGNASTAALTAALVALAAGVVIVAAIAYNFAESQDDQLRLQQREAVRRAAVELRASGDRQRIDLNRLRTIEQTARIDGLTFETEPSSSGREMQPVLDAAGRIVGFFAWPRANPMATAVLGLMPSIAGCVAVLLALAGFISRAGRRRVPRRHAPRVANDSRVADAAADEQTLLRRELAAALNAGALDVHYQPIVAAQGGRMVGAEALARWTHPERGAIGPAVFIPIAEQTGLIDTLGTFVLRRALSEAKRWPDLYLAVNLSPLQVRNPALRKTIRSALEENGVAASRLVLEITEGVLIDDPDEMAARLSDLHELGLRIALDDFGAGYSNLGYLQRFPLDKLKIDRSFVHSLGKSANGGVIIKAIVALGRALGLSVLAEGVETEQQRVLLRLAGCDEMQGFLFGKPAPAETIEALVRQSALTRVPALALTA